VFKSKKISSPNASPTKSTIASSPFHMQTKISGEEKEVNSFATTKRKRKLLEELEVVNGQQDGVKDLLDVVKLMESGMGCIWF
jgi:hypothetical protein